jgi:hypothetical protein
VRSMIGSSLSGLSSCFLDFAMNTPPKKRRHAPAFPDQKGAPKSGHYVGSLENEEYAKRFACILSEFEHLEARMPGVLAILLGTTDINSVGYVYRTLRNPNIRRDVMKALLEKAPLNKDRGEEFDALLSEYNSIRKARNDYAHGLWYTEENGSVMLAREAEHGFGMMEAAPEPIKELDDLVARIRKLTWSVIELQMAEQKRLHTGHPLQSGEPTKA